MPTYLSQITLSTESRPVADFRSRHVLFVGTGPVGSQVFLGNLTGGLITRLKRQGKQAEFFYAGAVSEGAPFRIDSSANPDVDTYVLFRATGETTLNMTKEKIVAGAPGITLIGYGNQFVQDYNVSVYSRRHGPSPVWEGKLHIDIDLANDARYRGIASRLSKELAKSRIVL
ncbi:hypothetical protein GCM10023184_27510 [Flaviaesturariibacter amylovorans]|uniref:Uncharacterized protein n=2 Tax=Flaviaesturariibacter amylovorans TaxID=1084520 RepID=A0ABP8H3P3_9BACT